MQTGNFSTLVELGMGGSVTSLAVHISGRGIAATVNGEHLLGGLLPIPPEVPALTLLHLESNGRVLTTTVSAAIMYHGGTHAFGLLVVNRGLDPVGDVYGKRAGDILALPNVELDSELRNTLALKIGSVGAPERLKGHRCASHETVICGGGGRHSKTELLGGKIMGHGRSRRRGSNEKSN
jgi:hypothetical protein